MTTKLISISTLLVRLKSGFNGVIPTRYPQSLGDEVESVLRFRTKPSVEATWNGLKLSELAYTRKSTASPPIKRVGVEIIRLSQLLAHVDMEVLASNNKVYLLTPNK